MSSTSWFLSSKVGVVRWSPSPMSSLSASASFVSSSWDDRVNTLSLWSYSTTGSTLSDEPPSDPVLIAETPHSGWATDIQYLDGNTIVTTSSVGDVSAYRLQPSLEGGGIGLLGSLPVHKGAAAALAVHPSVATVVSVGEDGAFTLIDMGESFPTSCSLVRDACSSAFTDVHFVSESTFVAVGGSSLKRWDTRALSSPIHSFQVAPETTLECVTVHPFQSDIVVTGGSDGVLSLWDLRQSQWPLSRTSAHVGHIWEAKFDSRIPDFVYTCGEDGVVLAWDFNTRKEPEGVAFASASTPNKVAVDGLLAATLAVNSLDVHPVLNTLVCGGDNAALMFHSNLVPQLGSGPASTAARQVVMSSGSTTKPGSGVGGGGGAFSAQTAGARSSRLGAAAMEL